MISQQLAASYTCDSPTPISNFDVTRFAGTWYEQQHSKDPQEPSSYQCSTAQYTDLVDDETDSSIKHFKVYNSFQSKVLGLWTPRIGVHANARCGTNGECYVVFFGHEPETPNLTVIDTDYDNYAINYWCDDSAKFAHIWINTRTPTVSDEYFNSLYAKAMGYLPSFDETILEPRLTQGDMCSYHALNQSPSAVSMLLSAINF